MKRLERLTRWARPVLSVGDGRGWADCTAGSGDPGVAPGNNRIMGGLLLRRWAAFLLPIGMFLKVAVGKLSQDYSNFALERNVTFVVRITCALPPVQILYPFCKLINLLNAFIGRMAKNITFDVR